MLINPYEIFNKDEDDDLAIIIDCKNTETESRDMQLDYKLGRISLESAQRMGINNIVLFEDREDFDIAVSELTKIGVAKIIYVFSGTLFENTARRLIKRHPHLSAFKVGNYVFRKFFIFDTAKYKFFDIRDPFLGNVADELTSVSMDSVGITYLNPEENNYKFLEMIANREVPNINLLLTDSEVDLAYAKLMVDLSDDLLNG